MTVKTEDTTTKEILNTREAAAMLKVTTQTIKNYIYSGRLKALKTPGGHHRIRRIDLQKLGFDMESVREPQILSTNDLWSAYNNLIGTLVSTIEALIKALDTRDIVSSGHSSRVAGLACLVGKKLDMPEKEMQDLRLAALLHDVGKVGISETILGKPGRLTDQEIFLMKQHPEIGERIISEIDHLRPIAASVRHHHERYDGMGYPDKIQGSDIEMNARIISVAETYDFLRSDLSFRKAFSVGDSLRELENSAGTQFDPHIVNYFVGSIKDGSQFH